MKKMFLIFISLIYFSVQSAFAVGLDEKIDRVFAPFSDFFSNLVFTPVSINGVDVPILILLLIFASILFTLYLNGINVWGFTKARIQAYQSAHPTQNLNNVLIAVVRYFGGTKLGASNLLRAYLDAAKDAMNQNEKRD